MKTLKTMQKEHGDDYILKPTTRSPLRDSLTEVQTTESIQPSPIARISDAKTEDNDIHEDSSVGSFLLSSGFDKENQSEEIHPSTLATSQHKSEAKLMPVAPRNLDDTEISIAQRSDPAIDHLEVNSRDIRVPEAKVKLMHDWDAETTYSLDDDQDNSQAPYIQVFAGEIAKYLKGVLNISEFAWANFDSVLKKFAWRLHGESSNPFQWEAAVTLHQQRTWVYLTPYLRSMLTFCM
jgi:hypothetical protein